MIQRKKVISNEAKIHQELSQIRQRERDKFKKQENEVVKPDFLFRAGCKNLLICVKKNGERGGVSF